MDRIKFWISCGNSALSGVRSRFSLAVIMLLLAAGCWLPAVAAAQTELGSEDDLTVLGVDGDAPDPDVEIKGFAVFGSTQAVYTGVAAGPGNVVVNGALAVSSGAYFVGSSTFPGAGTIFVNDGAEGQILSKNSGGSLQWTSAGAIGDNLGNHIATATLNMASWNMVGVSSVNFLSDVFITSAAAAQGGGVYVSTNLYIVGYSSAARYYGDGSALTGISGDNLGNHIATTTLRMGAYGVNTSSNITAARYQINGSTMVAILPGTDSIAYGVGAGASNIVGGNYNVFIGNGAGRLNTTGDYNTVNGYQALYSNTTAGGNTANGYLALYNNTTGGNNTANGYRALYANTTGVGNTANGQSALVFNTTGGNNTVSGSLALYSNLTGSANSVMGYLAGYGVSANSFSSSTIMGYQAGYGLTTGSDNLLLGFRSGDSLTTGSRNIIIGYDEDAPTATTNDYLNIGGLIVGDLATSSVTVLGDLYANNFIGNASGLTGISGDNLGSHIATATLNMASWNMVGVSSVNFLSDVFITSAAAAQGGGVYVSTNLYIVGYSSAARYYGDASSMTGLPAGDNLGNHIATTDLVLGANQLTGAGAVTMSSYTATGAGFSGAQVSLAGNVIISSEASAALGAGVRVSTNMYIVGFSSAAKYYGDGSALTGISGDNLGNHIATATLQMGAYGVNTSSNITAARYQINGSTMVAILPGTNSIAYGVGAGVSSIGSYNVFVGNEAGRSNTTGSDNTANGYGALYSNTTAWSNTANGRSALHSNTTGGGNTANGKATLYFNTTGGANTANGYAALNLNTTGDNNTANGYEALLSNTTGGNNTANGYRATYYNQTGSANSITGYEAGYGVASNSFSSATIMGYRAGYALATGSDNLLLGFQSGDSLTTGSRNIIIGYDEDAPTATTDDYLNIGGLIVGDLATSSVTVLGDLYANNFIGNASGLTGISGDNLGSHIATATLNMASWNMVGVSSVNFLSDVFITSAAAAQGGGVYVSTNLYIVGYSSAARYYGDGSALTGISGDNLGNHTATQVLQMGAYGVNTSSNITAARYQINGSTMVAVLLGVQSIAYGVAAGASNIVGGDYNVFIGYSAGTANTTGDYNAVNGYRALYSNTTGSRNTATGANSLYFNTAGDYNTATGYSALSSNTTGSRNTANGFNALNFNTTGSDNTVNGVNALYRNQTGSANSVMGYYAGLGVSANSFSSSTIMGYMAGYGLSTGSDNLLLGFQSGNSLTTGSRNIIIGYDEDAPTATTNDYLNIGGLIVGDLATSSVTVLGDLYANNFIGNASGLTGISGDNLGSHIATATLNMASWNMVGVSSVNFLSNVFISSAAAAQGGGVYVSTNLYIVGYSSAARYYGDGSALTGISGDNLGNHIATTTLRMGAYGVNTSSNITAARYQINGSTMVAILPGLDSIAYGVGAGASNIAGGDYNVFIGNGAGGSNTTGEFNTVNGYRALYSNTNGSYNTANGVNALYSSTTGSLNTANGADALYSNTTGASNTANGLAALNSNKTGSANAVFGAQAGFGVALNSFSSSTIMGYKAGYGLSTGSDNLLLGFQSGNSLTAGSRNIIIGYDEDAPTATTDDYLNIGGTIVGDLATSSVTVLGDLYANNFIGNASGLTGISGDNLGSHIATATLNMASWNMVGVSSVNFLSNVFITSAAAAQGGGVYVSTNLYIVGYSSAARYYGDASSMTGLPAGDNLGNHIATTDLVLGANQLTGAGAVTMSSYTATGAGFSGAQVSLAGNVIISSEAAAALGAGVRVSTNMYIVGFSSAAKYYGDGSALTGISGDNLGNHIATQVLQMGAYGVNTSSNITAARYQINGSTMMAILPGLNSIAYGVGAGASNIVGGDYNIFIGNDAGRSNTDGDFNTATGYNALYSNTSGFGNTANGAKALYFSTTGNSNTANGVSALYSNTTGGNNTANGYETLYSNTSGNQNTANGRVALYSNTTGNYNTANGMQVLYSNTTGANNTAGGIAALFNNQTGSANAVFGANAGYGVVLNSFSSSTIMGYQAGYGLTTGSDNLLLGFQSGDSLTTGSRNIIIGYNEDVPTATTNDYLNIGGLIVGNLATSSVTVLGDLYANNFIGNASGLTGISGDNLGSHIATATLNMASWNMVGVSSVNFLSNVFVSSAAAAQGGGVYVSTNLYIVGYSSAARYYGDGSALTGISGDNLGNHIATQVLQMGAYGVNTSSDITAARYQINGSTMVAILPGTDSIAYGVNAGASNIGPYNVFIGNFAGTSNTTGPYNTANGYKALYSNTTGTSNTANGHQALYSNTTGGANTANGGQALYYNTTGANNTANGYMALHSNTTGIHNTATGYRTLYRNQTGSANSLAGYGAGYGVSGNSFSSATIMGYQAGYGLTTGSDNLLLGFQSGDSLTAGSRNIIIGYDEDAPTATTNDYLNIGGLIVGDLATSSVTVLGDLYANNFIGNASGLTGISGDNLGSHIATAALNMASWNMVGVSSVNFLSDVFITSAAAAQGGGVYVSTNLYIVGYSSAARYYGDGSALTGISGDNLGNHTATQVLQMGAYGVNTSSDITAARYQVNGSTMVAILPGGNSIAYGVGAGASNILNGDSGVFIGNYAGNSNTTGDFNTVTGVYSLYSNTTGNGNTVNGSSALYSNTTGSRNSAYGYSALRSNTDANNNTASGAYALYNNQTGAANSAVGAYAGYGVNGNSFSSSTLMGFMSGYGLTTGSDNIFLGFQAGYSVTTGTGNIVIGYNIGPSGAAANNEINIGGVYKGNISSGTATIPKYTVQAADSGITLTAADFGKTITVNSASAQTVTLPAVTAADIGAIIIVLKLGAGKVTIDAPVGAYIADSGSGGTIYNNAVSPVYAAVTLRLATSTMWIPVSGQGAWITTN